MTGLGYLGSSSSASASSNLSPLAPPFTVDRSNQNKPVLNSNSLSHLNDPSYGVGWPYSQSSRKNLGDSARTTSLPINESGYSPNWSGVKCNGKHGLEQISSPHRLTDASSYYNHSEAKPFYASSVSNEVSFSSSYDLLSTTCQGDEVDYTRSLSGLEYKPQQQHESVWSGKQVKKHDDSFFSEEAYNSYMNQGGGGYGTGSKSKDDGSLFYHGDMMRRANKDSGGGGSLLSANEVSKTFRAFPMFSESHPLIQSHPYHMFDHHKPLVIRPPPPSASAAAVSDILEIGSLSALNIQRPPPPAKESEFVAPNHLLSFPTDDDDDDDAIKFEFKAKAKAPELMTTPPPPPPPPNVENEQHHNSAEDSPCWKGASHFLPFEADSPPMKKLQTQTIYSFNNSSQAADGSVAGKEHTAAAAAVDSCKPNKEHADGDNTQSHISQLKLPTSEYEDVDSSSLVKSLYNLSDLLLLHCSNDEHGLKEHDVEALDHVIRNLGVCMSRQVQGTRKNMAHEEEEVMSGYKKPMSDKSVVEHASLAKDDNMVQAIKKALDENLENKEEVPSLVYKDLWLEAEAELCSLSFKARVQRLKREAQTQTHSLKDAAADASTIKKEVSSCSDPDPPNSKSKPHIDGDDDAEVMARFNILKRRQDPPIPQVAPQLTLTALGKGIDPWVMDRLNILKSRGELNADADADVEEKDQGPHFQDEEEEAVGSGGGSDWEHILKDDFSWRLT